MMFHDASRADTATTRGWSRTKKAGSFDATDTIEEIRLRTTRMGQNAWSKDGILRIEGMMSLRLRVKTAVRDVLHGGFFDLSCMSGVNYDKMKTEMEIYLSYLSKGAKEYAVTDQKKESHIRHMIDCCMCAEWEFAAEKCKEALIEFCLEGGAWGRYAPKALMSNISKYDSNPAVENGMDPVVLCIDVLESMGMDVMHLYKKYWKEKAAVCARFVGHLLKGDKRHARRVALVGLERFPDSRLVAARAIEAVNSFDSEEKEDEDDVMLSVWCAMYVTHLNPEYYTMARASASWSKEWARRLATMLAAQKSFDEELEVLDDAGLDGEMLVAFVHDGTVRAAVRYKERMIKDHPDQYYSNAHKFLYIPYPRFRS